MVMKINNMQRNMFDDVASYYIKNDNYNSKL